MVFESAIAAYLVLCDQGLVTRSAQRRELSRSWISSSVATIPNETSLCMASDLSDAASQCALAALVVFAQEDVVGS